ncbi:MAG: acetate/propionate family kinase [Gammaproteobacteria bacterium]
MQSTRILTLNSGSSSLKAALYRMETDDVGQYSATVERIGQPGSRVYIADLRGQTLFEQTKDVVDHRAALAILFDWFRDQGVDRDWSVIGHRIVYGGSRFREPQRVTRALVSALRELVAMDPDHLPQACAGIEAAVERYPGLLQIACFDTAFHRHMPVSAERYALPRRFAEAGIMRLGFHGLSYEYIMQELCKIDSIAAQGRVVIGHLGNGASLVAVRAGVSIDTSMGFTPLAGLVMGTRSGDLDPGIVLHLLRAQGMTPDAVDDLLNKQSGLLGVSGVSGDMRDLLDRQTTDSRAAEAIEIFCYQAKKYIGAYAAALGGLDTLVFTAGIGARSPVIRARICAGLAFLGIELDERRNAGNEVVISAEGARVKVYVIATDEDRMIAQHARRLWKIRGGDSAGGSDPGGR